MFLSLSFNKSVLDVFKMIVDRFKLINLTFEQRTFQVSQAVIERRQQNSKFLIQVHSNQRKSVYKKSFSESCKTVL